MNLSDSWQTFRISGNETPRPRGLRKGGDASSTEATGSGVRGILQRAWHQVRDILARAWHPGQCVASWAWHPAECVASCRVRGSMASALARLTHPAPPRDRPAARSWRARGGGSASILTREKGLGSLNPWDGLRFCGSPRKDSRDARALERERERERETGERALASSELNDLALSQGKAKCQGQSQPCVLPVLLIRRIFFILQNEDCLSRPRAWNLLQNAVKMRIV